MSVRAGGHSKGGVLMSRHARLLDATAGHSEDQSPWQAWIPGGMPGMEVRTVITVLTVDDALQQLCATFREQADRGRISPTERDLLMDGAILLAMHVEDLDRESLAGSHQEPVRRHERHTPVAAA